jgi:hypothetical protein
MANKTKEAKMSNWRMTSAHFKYLLEEVQNHKCAITGLPLMPDNVWIIPITPRSKVTKAGPNNIQLVHESIVRLAREYSKQEILIVCEIILKNNKAKRSKTKARGWKPHDPLLIYPKIRHFNELIDSYQPKPPKKKPVTWGQAYRDALRYYGKQVTLQTNDNNR